MMARSRSDLSLFERWALNAPDGQFNACAGAIGGFASGVATCPLDVIKTKLQAQGGWRPHDAGGGHVGQPKLYNGLLGTGRVIWRDEGLRGMYRGLGPIILGYLPTWAVYFTVYNSSKDRVRKYTQHPFMVNLCSSVIAGASSTIVTNPIWVIKTRLMSQSVSSQQSHHPYDPRAGIQAPWHYRSTLDAARKMYMHEGILSFYSGLTPALLGLTHVAVQFPVYELLKQTFTGQPMGGIPNDGQKKTWSQMGGVLFATIISKILASSATYPHEVIRTRLQTQRRPVAGEQFLQGMGITPDSAGLEKAREIKYRGVVRTFRTILREEGWRAFYAGMGTNMMRAVPAATVTMCTYEYFMGVFKRTQRTARHKQLGGDDGLNLL